jgi:hypothetical protein
MSHKAPEVIELLEWLIQRVNSSKEPLSALSIGNIFYGLQSFQLNASHYKDFFQKVFNCIQFIISSDPSLDTESLISLKRSLIIILECDLELTKTFKALGLMDELVKTHSLVDDAYLSVFGAAPSPCVGTVTDSSYGTVAGVGTVTDTSTTSTGTDTFPAHKNGYERFTEHYLSKKLEAYPNIIVSSNRYLHGFEADVVVTATTRSDVPREEQKKEIIINIEIDGFHHQIHRKDKFCHLRDEVLRRNDIHTIRITSTGTIALDRALHEIHCLIGTASE